jgi:hypothetical protein
MIERVMLLTSARRRNRGRTNGRLMRPNGTRKPDGAPLASCNNAGALCRVEAEVLTVTEEVIAALERECAGGSLSADGNTVDQCLAPNFTCVTSVDGPQFRIESRETWVERRKRSNATVRIDDVAVALHGAVAIAAVLATEVAKEHDATIERVFYDVWIAADGGGWRLAERHESRPIQK